MSLTNKAHTLELRGLRVCGHCLLVMLTALPVIWARGADPTPGAYELQGPREPSDFSLENIPGLREAGIDLSLWGWGSYAGSTQSDPKHSWGTELELDITKTFANRIAFSADIEFIDYDDEMRGNLEQGFVSVLLVKDSGMLLTAGKFNSPFGVEPRDFWDRLTATPSLLFRAQPQDLRGVMLTSPLGDSGVTLRPFVVSGFNDEDSIPGRPSMGLMVEYKPNQDLTLGLTNWIGPGLQAQENDEENNNYYNPYSGYSSAYPGGEYANAYSSSVFALTNTWESPDFKSAKKGRLYFLDAQAMWKARPGVTLAAEYLLGSSSVDSDTRFWDGVLLLASYDIDEHWRAFGQWSYLDDADGVVTGIKQSLQEIGVGIAYRINRHVELRTEYRHDFSDKTEDVDSVSVNASFGY